MKKLPITLTLPESIIRELHLYVSKRKISQFVAQMVAKGLEAEKQRLAKEFQEASRDEDRNADIELWDTFSQDGLDETNEY